jgi:hypothetical protein
MPQKPVKQILDDFPFLDDRSAQEPYLYDVLCEIERIQQEGYEKGAGGFASKEAMSDSRLLHIPFSPTRDKNIQYILELLASRFSDYIRTMVTFDFRFDDVGKKLMLLEHEEYSINLPFTEHEALVAERDETSLHNFNVFIQNFRLFNLDKVVKRARYKTDLNRVIQKGLGKEFFTYNHYFVEKNRLESAEEYCFHASNYESVKNTLNMQQFLTIIATYGDLVKNRLRKFGIMNSDISDYRDAKIDYIISILLDDMGSSLVEKDRIEIKNFKSLRECLLQVDKVLNPAQILNTDIVKYIRQNGMVSAGELASNIMNLTPEILIEWEKPERLLKEHIVKQNDVSGIIHFIDAFNLIPLFAAAINGIKAAGDTGSSQSHNRDIIKTRAETLYNASKSVLRYATAQTQLGGKETDVHKLAHLTEEYEALLKKATLQAEMARTQAPVEKKKGRPFYLKVLTLLSSIFGIFSRSPEVEGGYLDEYEHTTSEPSPKREPRRETRDIYEKANSRRGPIVALSDLIEINMENDAMITRIIQELRDNNLKLVVPIYNARVTLYPKRSKKLLMSDIEYLLIPISVIKSLDTIADYINSLVGHKLKEEVMPGRALVAIEKYLRVLFRQRRLSQMRKKEQREKSMKKK